ncbi:MAG: c-type cytochrome [Pseudomonadota bacterium]
MQRAVLIALLSPTFALAASTAQRELAAVVSSTPDLARGEALFAQCTTCHHADGGGDSDGSTPRISGQHFRVLAKQLVDFRYGKRWDFRMEGMADKHHLVGAQDIADVANYVSRLDKLGKRGVGSGGFVEDGRRIYAAQCQSCHGAGAEGTEAGVPRLAGQHYAYLMRQMYDAVDGRRPALSRLHGKRIAPLDFEQVRAVADYLARVGWHND